MNIESPTHHAGVLLLIMLLVGCGALPRVGFQEENADGPPSRPVDLSGVRDAVPRVEPFSKYGNPSSYEVFDRRYHVLDHSIGYVQRGIASWYGTKFHGRRTSSGEPYDMYEMTAAHKTLPLPTYVEVVNLDNGKKAVVRVNDRGPFVDNRLIDLSYAAAVRLGVNKTGTARVEVRAIDPVEWRNRVLENQATGEPLRQDGVYLQIGAFSKAENAARLRSRIDGIVSGSGIHVVRAQAANSPIYRVRIGPISDLTEADRMSRDLLALGVKDAHIVFD